MNPVAGHYSRDNLLGSLLEALAEAGLDIDHLHPDDLAPLDEFHIGGRRATREMIELAEIGPTDHVLDVGAGIGGPARSIAAATGCRVTGVDITEDYCHVATELTARVGLDARVEFQQADAQALPYPDAAFDVVWTQHMSMNVPDKDRLFAELARVLRPAGRLVCYEVIAGEQVDQGLHYPVPWADSDAISHLDDAAGLHRRITASGMSVSHWLDRTREGIEFFRRMARDPDAGNRRLGLHLLVGSDMKTRAANLLRNLEEGRVGVVLIRAERRA